MPPPRQKAHRTPSIELGILSAEASADPAGAEFDSQRSSLDTSDYEAQNCDVFVRDEESNDGVEGAGAESSSWHRTVESRAGTAMGRHQSARLAERLEVR